MSLSAVNALKKFNVLRSPMKEVLASPVVLCVCLLGRKPHFAQVMIWTLAWCKTYNLCTGLHSFIPVAVIKWQISPLLGTHLSTYHTLSHQILASIRESKFGCVCVKASVGPGSAKCHFGGRHLLITPCLQSKSSCLLKKSSQIGIRYHR
jgi:hypothetical protein